ncbi:dynein light intermediate chain-domain-containing protein [Pseudomassariella vexata]|uniref:Dynein light intermediate chain-domain-containing protein n=1 Tax=Pseudomassariella vexata TaxID=1141098 RepID=A0A1Y2E886_9PEZI|nr:dynein light intermediate chain-domain-containing protein [Pseudomassariella vexata]ORY67781.1 dynein light intermediate chain-domain-containing protein [Pseudomassariella vexata]
MTANSHRSTGSGPDSKNGEPKKDMWSSMLDSVASGRRLPEKNLLVLGGTVDSQRDFFEALSNNASRRNLDRHNLKVPPIANSFALGYTYYDVLDDDQDDILARISLYLLSTPSPSFASLLKPLLTPKTISDTLIVILLDWSQPWQWLRQLREWLLLLRAVITSLGPECNKIMEDVMAGWQDRGRVGGTINLDGTGAVPSEGDVPLPAGPGEWEDALGLPLCVVCQNSEQINYLEKSQGWKEEQFDQVLQYLRTVLLKHGASLIYTTPSTPSLLQPLIHASLGIHSLVKRQSLKHNTIDRDKIVIPPNWDSWGKIRILRDAFDVEAVSTGWGIDLSMDFATRSDTNGANGITGDAVPDPEAGMNGHDNGGVEEPEGSAVVLYESQVQDSSLDALQFARGDADPNKLEKPSVDTQAFLAKQVDRLNEERKADEQAAARDAGGRDYSLGAAGPDEVVSDAIGPVQFNMGGIQVDADDMVQRLKDRQAQGLDQSPTLGSAAGTEDDDMELDPSNMAETDTERLAQFFGNLMNRKK